LTSRYLEAEGIKLGNSFGDGSGAGFLSLKTGVVANSLNSLEEFLGFLLLLRSSGKVSDGTTGLAHVTVELVGDFVPLCLFDVSRDLSKTKLGLLNNGLLTGGVFGVVLLVKGVFSCVSVDRVRRVSLARLVRSVSGTLRVRGAVSEKSEDRESGRLSSSGVGSSRDKNGGTSSDNSGEGLTARFLCKWNSKKRNVRSVFDKSFPLRILVGHVHQENVGSL
jgi:hypothetical protein